MLRTSDLEYDLPPGSIAVRPAEPRDAARLMVVDRERGAVEHRGVGDLPDVLRPGDLLVMNASRVLAARFLGVREDSGGAVEGLYLREATPAAGGGGGPGGARWVAMVKARRFRAGAPIRLLGHAGERSRFVLCLVERLDGAEWLAAVRADGGGAASTPDILGEVGLPPIPPYILSARRAGASGDGATDLAGVAGVGAAAPPESVEARGASAMRSSEEADTASYQTVYAGGLVACADGTEVGSVAAPTAGLHFTPALLGRLRDRGVETAEVVLHVGAGTFKPVEAEFVEQHTMHAEWCSMGAMTREAIERVRRAGGRIVCVGTTSARTVEAFGSAAEGGAAPVACAIPENWGGVGAAPSVWLHTRLLITPGYRWRWVDGLMTNFHLPRSTLMALVAAMLPGGVEELKRLYAEAMGRGYRFYSYGDAMLVV